MLIPKGDNKVVIYLIALMLIILTCKSESNLSSKISALPQVVGDIEFDPTIDGDFERCDPYSNQYYGINGG